MGGAPTTRAPVGASRLLASAVFDARGRRVSARTAMAAKTATRRTHPNARLAASAAAPSAPTPSSTTSRGTTNGAAHGVASAKASPRESEDDARVAIALVGTNGGVTGPNAGSRRRATRSTTRRRFCLSPSTGSASFRRAMRPRVTSNEVEELPQLPKTWEEGQRSRVKQPDLA